ncbi:MAG: hypothetical protein U0U67_06125 [Chitinophagales bacterium]
MTDGNFNIGVLLRTYFIKNNVYRIGLAKKMGIKVQQIFYAIRTKSMDVNRLVAFSHGLQHNFLMDIAAQLPDNYTTDAKLFTKKEEEIAVLKENTKVLEDKIKALEAENALLLKVLKVDKA